MEIYGSVSEAGELGLRKKITICLSLSILLYNSAESNIINIVSHFQKILGISNTIGRVIAGWISDFSCVNALLVTNLAIFFSGVSTLVLPFCTSYGAFATIALLFGFFVAAYISLTSIVLVDLLGLDNLTSAFGLLVLFRGVSSMVSYTTFSKL